MRFLVAHLGLRSYESAEEILSAYYPMDRFPAYSLAALREIIASH